MEEGVRLLIYAVVSPVQHWWLRRRLCSLSRCEHLTVWEPTQRTSTCFNGNSSTGTQQQVVLRLFLEKMRLKALADCAGSPCIGEVVPFLMSRSVRAATDASKQSQLFWTTRWSLYRCVAAVHLQHFAFFLFSPLALILCSPASSFLPPSSPTSHPCT